MLLQLSQSALALLEQCPRKFQHRYLDQLAEFVPSEQRDRMEWGNQFHQLMQQRELGLPITSTAEERLLQCVDALVNTVPEVFDPSQWRDRLSEHRRLLRLGDIVLTAVYDLLLLGDRHAHIIDWKTYPRPPRSDWLRQHWQTRLYPYVLAETSDYAPEQIAMTYWFVQPQSESSRPESMTFPYSVEQHQHTHATLSQRFAQLNAWLMNYHAGTSLPMQPQTDKDCQHCPFAVRCQRGDFRPIAPEVWLNPAAIEEVAL
jgi:hypothetical protein